MQGHKPLTPRAKLARSGQGKREQQAAPSKETVASGRVAVDQITRAGIDFSLLYHTIDCMARAVSFVGLGGA
jgi:hypothetical protein